jgi:two-component system NarL family sensor kinase
MWNLLGNQNKQTLRQSCSELEMLVLERTVALQNLSQRLLRVQDEERRKVARDLHDSTGQTLTALKISVTLLQRKLQHDKGTREELAGIASLVDEALQEIRTTSYLLHPPLLDESGLTSAAQWYLAGFAQRSGIKVRVDFASMIDRLPNQIENALFRVLQESLTNVHRHSGSFEVDVSLRREGPVVILEVRDYGCGISKKFPSSTGMVIPDSGVGLAGMRERLNELEGGLEIEPANPGTRLRATVPLLALSAAAHAA